MKQGRKGRRNSDSRPPLTLSTDGLCEVLDVTIEKGLPCRAVLEVPRHKLYAIGVLDVGVEVGVAHEAVHTPDRALLIVSIRLLLVVAFARVV